MNPFAAPAASQAVPTQTAPFVFGSTPATPTGPPMFGTEPPTAAAPAASPAPFAFGAGAAPTRPSFAFGAGAPAPLAGAMANPSRDSLGARARTPLAVPPRLAARRLSLLALQPSLVALVNNKPALGSLPGDRSREASPRLEGAGASQPSACQPVLQGASLLATLALGECLLAACSRPAVQRSKSS
eukprot:jgi/Botrbrau1/22607/Bobra.176_1s0037.1